MKTSITDVKGILVGHAQDEVALTGCTVVLCPNGAVGGVDQRGGAPGTRETDALKMENFVGEVHAILLTGGSAFGLSAATGVVRYLEENGYGLIFGELRIPIVPAGVIFDLGIGDNSRRPDEEMGYQACCSASTYTPKSGCAGAGMGATAGKINGMAGAVKTGIGTASANIGDNLTVGALVVANPFGDVIDPHSGKILAGARRLDSEENSSQRGFVNTLSAMAGMLSGGSPPIPDQSNTVIGVVATNASLTKPQATKVAQMAQDGLARTIRPAHTLFDGDTIFCLATGENKRSLTVMDINILGSYAAEVFAAAVLDSVDSARSSGGVPAAIDLDFD